MGDAANSNEQMVQSQFGITTIFGLGDDELTHIYRDPSGELRFSVPYENIWLDSPAYLTINNGIFALRWLWAYVLVIGGVIALTLMLRLHPFFPSLALLAALIAFVTIRLRTPFVIHFRLLPVSLEAFGPPVHEVRVIDDETGQAVIAEINRKWRERLRAIYAFVDAGNDLDQEAVRFHWLKDRGVISEAEFQSALTELQRIRAGEQPTRPLH